MRLYLYFMFSAFFMFKDRGYSNPKFYVSILSTFIITLFSLNIFFILKTIFDLSNSFIIAIFPIVVFFEKLSDKSFAKAYVNNLKSYGYLESKKMQNTITVIVYYIVALFSVIITVGVTKYYD